MLPYVIECLEKEYYQYLIYLIHTYTQTNGCICMVKYITKQMYVVNRLYIKIFILKDFSYKIKFAEIEQKNEL